MYRTADGRYWGDGVGMPINCNVVPKRKQKSEITPDQGRVKESILHFPAPGVPINEVGLIQMILLGK